MKIKEYIRLSYINFIENKRQNCNLIFGLTLAEFLLIPVIFVLFSFHFGFMKSVDETKTLSSAIIKFDDNRYSSQFDYFNTKYENDILNIPGITEYTKYFVQPMPKNSIITIDNSEYNLNYYRQFYNISESIEFYDVKNSSKVITSEEEKYVSDTYGESAILAGTTLIEDETGIVISSDVLDYFGIAYADAIGKKINYQTTITSSYQAMDENGEYYKDTLRGTNVDVFKDYTIIGVFNTKLYYSTSRDGGDGDIVSPSLWLNLSTLYNENNELVFKDFGNIIADKDELDIWVFNYQYNTNFTDVFTSITDLKKVFLPLGFIYTFCDGVYFERIQFSDFLSLYNSIPMLMNYASLSNQYCREGDSFLYSITSEVAVQYINYYPLVNKISAAVLFFSVIIMISGILNINNVVSYSIFKRKGYLGMMRAMGLKDKRISLLYLTEFLFPVTIALVISFIISFPISIGVSKLIDINIKRYNDYLPVAVKLDLSYYPIAFFGIAIIMFLITYTMIKINCFIIERKRISELIYEQ